MQDWKAAGRAQREHEDDLWSRFRGAQDVFFQARGEVFAERDTEQRENLARKEELAAEAEKLLPVTDLKAARAAFRAINERWEAIGHVPRDARPKIEGRMHAVERAIQEAEEAEWRRTNPEARARAAGLTGQLQAAVDKLRAQVETARAAGNSAKADKLEQELDGPPGALGPGAEGPAGVAADVGSARADGCRRSVPDRSARWAGGVRWTARHVRLAADCRAGPGGPARRAVPRAPRLRLLAAESARGWAGVQRRPAGRYRWRPEVTR